MISLYIKPINSQFIALAGPMRPLVVRDGDRFVTFGAQDVMVTDIVLTVRIVLLTSSFSQYFLLFLLKKGLGLFIFIFYF